MGGLPDGVGAVSDGDDGVGDQTAGGPAGGVGQGGLRRGDPAAAKGSLLRAQVTADWAATHVDAGRQVLVSCEFVAAAAEPIAAALEAARIPVARIYGGTGLDKEVERLRFQRGEAKVVVHRDHQVCPWWLGFAADTVEEHIAQVMVTRFRASADTAGADSSALAGVAKLLGVPWLPPLALTDPAGG